MVEQELFPTPVPVIKKMLAPYIKTFEYKSRWGPEKITTLKFDGLFLDPQSGNGAILDYVTEKLIERRNVVAIELDMELRFLLQGKGYTVIGSDFLEYDEPVEFGLIIANPPFSTGVKHALKIWEVLAGGGNAAILLNRETINNPNTKERRLLLSILAGMINYPFEARIIDQGFDRLDDLANLLQALEAEGWIEYLGQCFLESERPTDVEVGLIRFTKPAKDFTISFDKLPMDLDGGVSEEEFAANPLAHPNVIKDTVSRYNAALATLKERHITQSKLDFYLQGISLFGFGDHLEKSLVRSESLAEQVATLKSRFWDTVFQKTKLRDRTTSHFHGEFRSFARQNQSMGFTETNIYEVLGMFFQNQGDIMQSCMIDVFDKLSGFCAENKIHTEGWKTNKSWRLNKKIIHPYGVRHDKKWGFSTQYSNYDIYTDLDKVLCWLDGVNVEKGVRTSWAIDNFIRCTRDYGKDYRDEFESYFFKIHIFKKGTVHLIFKDLKLLAQFNRQVAEGKQWLGDGS